MTITKRYKLDYDSPIGVIKIKGNHNTIESILFSEEEYTVHNLEQDTPPLLEACYRQLDEYFKGTRLEFTIPYQLEGTPFQQTVWKALRDISYGETGSYKDLASSIGKEKAIRAVGNANGKNKLSIIIPCHRIIGSDGTLTGYAGGLWRKEWLLQHEKNTIQK